MASTSCLTYRPVLTSGDGPDQTGLMTASSLDVEALRVTVFRRFAESGSAGPAAELAAATGQPEPAVVAALRELAAQRHLVLDGDDRIVMAHPFSSVPLGFSVMGQRTLWWGGCAWDSFALPHLLPDEGEVLVATRCPACGAPHALSVGSSAPPPGDQVAHFPVPVARMWDDVVHTCGGQRLFCSPDCLAAWLNRTGQAEGYVMDLPTLWRFASRWYEGRLEYGYQRRDPVTAAAYFREVGLRGPFWGL
jgi:Alkylmercury lyase